MKSFLFLFFLYICISAQTETTIQLKDGKIFDKGFELTKPSENAPEELNKLVPLIGKWNVEIKTRTSVHFHNPHCLKTRWRYKNV